MNNLLKSVSQQPSSDVYATDNPTRWRTMKEPPAAHQLQAFVRRDTVPRFDAVPLAIRLLKSALEAETGCESHLWLCDDEGAQVVVADGAGDGEYAHHALAIPPHHLPACRLHPRL